ncbi:OLC1v1011511C2 [Oldenlandia corymbosa var. corymbosa]|uniref:OLC1v1011511C2 n=1 Tax=Oldenlandia corymbosa var. corymbosa TaxID=529605 RepID=A0AAV1DX87_OLDCO|nr:OLC1v1011511C2 [Oldenlandia corymbosa var. corymbosa]
MKRLPLNGIQYAVLNGNHRHHSVSSPSLYKDSRIFIFARIRIFPAFDGNRWLSTKADSIPSEFRGSNAYEMLGVSETSSLAEIKASFHKLAKETHPDLADSSASRRFIKILAAYEILSDDEKRAHYDEYLLSQRVIVQGYYREGSVMYTYESRRAAGRETEVVEWLKWYRNAVNEILAEKRVVVGSGYFDVLERDFYSAIHAAFYGPEIDSFDLLPECFEAEVRSDLGTPEVLHLVSGRDLFGMVCVANHVPVITHAHRKELTSFASDLCRSVVGILKGCGTTGGGIHQKRVTESGYDTSDAYKNLELYIAGRLVAVATRVPPKIEEGKQNKEDRIRIYLVSHGESTGLSQGIDEDSDLDYSVGYRVPLGSISGLGTSPEEGSCTVYDNREVNTHVIMKHRTLLVKHLHWYQLGERASICECRCTRARLPPSKFWIFEPRCCMHDIGGWYVETFGRDKKARNVPSQRYWNGSDTNQFFEKSLHPAMYLLALAYRSLDIEDAKMRKKAMKDIVEANMFRILSWFKKLV